MDPRERDLIISQAKNLTQEEIAQMSPEEMDNLEKMLDEQERDKPSQLEAGIRGVMQGVTMGFSDEIEAGLRAAVDHLAAQVTDQDGSFSDRMNQQLNIARDREKASQKEYPLTYSGSEIAGGVASMLVPTGAALKAGTAVGKATTATVLTAKETARLAAKASAARIGNAVATGAAFGAASAAGKAEDKLSKESLVEIATGAGVGAATSGVLAAGSELITKMAPDMTSVWRKMFGVNNASKTKELDTYLKRMGQTEDDFFEKMVNYKVGEEPMVKAFDKLDDVQVKSSLALNEADRVKSAILEKANVKLSEEEARGIFGGLRAKLTERLDNELVPESKTNVLAALQQLDGTEANFINSKVNRALEMKDPSLISFDIKDLYNVKKQLQATGFKQSGLNAETKEVLKDVSSMFNESIDDFIHVKSLSGKLPENIAQEFKQARIDESNLIRFNGAVDSVIKSQRNKALAPFSELFKGAAVAGAGMSAGISPELAIATAASLRTISKLPQTSTTVAVGMSKLANYMQQDPGKGAEIIQTLAAAANNSADTFRKAASSEYSKINLREQPIERNTVDVVNKQNSILAIAEYENPDLAKQLRDAISNNDDELVASSMDMLSKSPKLKPFFKDGIGFNGKVYDPQDKANLAKQLESMQISLVQRLKLKKDLMEKNIVPVVQQEPDMVKQFMGRNKKNPQY